MSQPQARPELEMLRAYQAVAGPDMKHNLSANEACLGASPKAIAAAVAAAKAPHLYPDGGARALREALGERYSLDPDRIICSAGSEELISLIVQAYCAPGDEVLFPQYGFIKYELAARSFGMVPVRAPEVDFVASVDALLAAVSERTRVVFLANPNNPTGTYLPDAEVRRLRALLREDILLVVDAAYAEFVDRPDYSDGLKLAADTANTLVLRTFSKIHGLAALRCGWGYGDPGLIDPLHKVRGAFNVSSIAQAAAVAAIGDRQHEERARLHNARCLPWLAERLSDVVQVVPSVCNFLLLRFKDADQCERAKGSLARSSVLAMGLTGYGLPEALRVTVGTDAANAAVVEAIRGVFK